MRVKLGREPGLGAVWASLLCVRRADRGLQSGVRVAAEMRTSAGLGSVPGMKLGTSVSAVRSQDRAAARMSAVTAFLAHGAAADVGSARVQRGGRRRTKSTYSRAQARIRGGG